MTDFRVPGGACGTCSDEHGINMCFPKQTCELCGKEYDPQKDGINLTVTTQEHRDSESLSACYECLVQTLRLAKADKPIVRDV